MNNQEEIDYFRQNFENSDNNNLNDNNNNYDYSNYYLPNQQFGGNNNITNNHLYQKNYNINNYSNNSTSYTNSFSSSNNNSYSNSFSNISYFNSMNSNSINKFNSNLPYSSSFQFQNSKDQNFIAIINNKKCLSDNNLKVNPIMITKNLIEMSSNDLYTYITTQKGSRETQTIINKMKEYELDILLTRIFPVLRYIMTDKYGNYFTQKLIQICQPPQRIKLLENLKGDFLLIAKDIYGTHPLQCLIETINMLEEKKLVLQYIINNEIELALDQRGANVLKKYIICTKEEERISLNYNLINHLNELIINQYGVIILISLIKHTKNKDIHKKIAYFIGTKNPLFYIRHPYSNYVVQTLLIYSDLDFCNEIIKTIINNYLNLSLEKYSNKVVEYCIKCGKNSTVKKIFNDIMDRNNLEILLNNNYGSFVLEKIIIKLKKEEKIKMVKKLQELGKINDVKNPIKNLLEI